MRGRVLFVVGAGDRVWDARAVDHGQVAVAPLSDPTSKHGHRAGVMGPLQDGATLFAYGG